MRFGPWSQDVTVHACQVSLPDGMPRRVRVTQQVLDYMFGDAQTPLRQALTALVHATMGNPRVAPRLQELINHAANAMTLETPTGQFIASIEAVISEARLVDTADAHVIVAFRRLERVVREFQAWAAVNASRPENSRHG